MGKFDVKCTPPLRKKRTSTLYCHLVAAYIYCKSNYPNEDNLMEHFRIGRPHTDHLAKFPASVVVKTKAHIDEVIYL